MTSPKTASGRFFEDFQIGESLRHATPRTLRGGDVSLYSALYGSRFAAQSAETFALSIGYPAAPIDDLLAFHVVFGKSVPDVMRKSQSTTSPRNADHSKVSCR